MEYLGTGFHGGQCWSLPGKQKVFELRYKDDILLTLLSSLQPSRALL
jgi:hypothetical protein